MTDTTVSNAATKKRQPAPYWFCTKTKAALLSAIVWTLLATLANHFHVSIIEIAASVALASGMPLPAEAIPAAVQGFMTTAIVAYCKNKD